MPLTDVQVRQLKPRPKALLADGVDPMVKAKDEHTSHGFRASASSLLNESGKWNQDAIEAELAHVGSNHVRRAYHRARYWDERVKMADWWADQVRRMIS